MEHLREACILSPEEFSSKCSRLNESTYASYKIVKPKLQESCDVNSIIKVGQKLKESLDDGEKEVLEKILEALRTNGADTSFKVWRLPVARYDVKNLNGRIYPKKLWENIRDRQTDTWKNLAGLADHPIEDDDPGLFRDQAVIWHDMEIGDDNVVYGICSFIGPWGHLAEEMLEHGGRVGTSSSGFGDVDKYTKLVDPETYQVERLADLVLNPSQGTYGSSNCTHVKPEDFMKDPQSAAVINFTGNHPIKESAENQPAGESLKENQPRSRILMAKANAAEQTSATLNQDVPENKTALNESQNRLSKVEEKAFRQYVESFIDRKDKMDNPLKRLNECTDILSCFEEGNCQDLREKVENDLLAEKERLEKLVESTSTVEQDYGMDVAKFREAAERNTKTAIILNEQVTDYKALVDELSKRNAKLKEENANLQKEMEEKLKLSESKIKTTNMNIVDSLSECDKLQERTENLEAEIKALRERNAKLSVSNSKFEKDNGVLETRLREARDIILNNKKLKEDAGFVNKDLEAKVKKLQETIVSLKEQNTELSNAYDNQCDKFDKLQESYSKYKEQVTDMMDPTKHMAPSAHDRIGKYLKESDYKKECRAYFEDLKESYGEAIDPFESEIAGARTLKEATSAFLRHRNAIIPEFQGTEAPDFAYRNNADRSRIYESVGMLNPVESYKNASLDVKNKEFLDKQAALGLY